MGWIDVVNVGSRKQHHVTAQGL